MAADWAGYLQLRENFIFYHTVLKVKIIRNDFAYFKAGSFAIRYNKRKTLSQRKNEQRTGKSQKKARTESRC